MAWIADYSSVARTVVSGGSSITSAACHCKPFRVDGKWPKSGSPLPCAVRPISVVFISCTAPPRAAARSWWPKADAQEGPIQLGHPVFDGGLLHDQPKVLFLLPNVLRAARGHHEVEGFQVRDRLTGVEFDRRQAEAGVLEQRLKRTGCSSGRC
jgi:hypothetical protein